MGRLPRGWRKTRKFNGKRYVHVVDHQYKSSIEADIRSLKRQGYSIRRVKIAPTPLQKKGSREQGVHIPKTLTGIWVYKPGMKVKKKQTKKTKQKKQTKKKTKRRKRVPRTIYEMGIPRRLVKRVSSYHKRKLREMNRKIYPRKIRGFTSVGDIEDWVAEYVQEGHIL